MADEGRMSVSIGREEAIGLALDHATERESQAFYHRVGGEEVWQAMNDFVEQNWAPERILQFNEVARSGDPQAIDRAVHQLRVEFSDGIMQANALGKEPIW